MNYEETLDYLYNSAPLFQHIGKDAYKAGLEKHLSFRQVFQPSPSPIPNHSYSRDQWKRLLFTYFSRHFTISRIQDRTLHFSTSDRFP